MGELEEGREVRAVLYARVSTRGQAERGYSLAQQMEALREHCVREGFEIVTEVEDAGYTGATLDRPGMDRVRDLVEAGGVDVVLAQDRDRFAREPSYLDLLKFEFKGHGVRLRALNDRGDDSPEGELTDRILDQIARFERLKTMERTRRGKREKARRGLLVGGRNVNLGFRLNETREGYEIDAEKMAVVRRIFRTVGEEGRSLTAVKTGFEREGIPAPHGGKWWNVTTIKRIIENDVYLARLYEEVRALISAEAAARLDPGKRYGIYWYGRNRVQRVPGRKTKIVTEPTDPASWVAIPVPDCGIPPEWVEVARERIKDNVRFPSSSGRGWYLRGRIRCACGAAMTTYHNNKGRDYYVCSRHRKRGDCEYLRYQPAEETERRVEDFVLALVRYPETLREKLERWAEEERERLKDAQEEAARWARRLHEIERKRDRLVEMRADGDIGRETFRAKVSALDGEAVVAKRETSRLSDREATLREIEALPGLVEDFLGDFPGFVDGGAIREYETVPPHADGKPYRLSDARFRFLTEEELAEKRAERSERFLAAYALLNLKVIAHKDLTLDVHWGIDCHKYLAPE